MRLDLDVANLIIFISKTGEKLSENHPFFIFWRQIRQNNS
jgi:hypothetical protein